MAKSSAWWRADKDAVHSEVNARLKILEEQGRDMRLDNLLYLQIASNWNVDGTGSYGAAYWKSNGKKLRRNLAAAACDYAASLIAANRTIPSYQSTNGDFEVSRKAEQRARVLHSQMWTLGAFDLGVDAFYTGCYTGTGATHGFINPDTGLPELVNPLPNSLTVDLDEGRNPSTLYWTYFKPRELLEEIYKKRELATSAGPSYSDSEEYFLREDTRSSCDMVKVVEAWHLPPVTGSKLGRHVITVSNCTLVDEPYTRKRFPFAFYRYSRRPSGSSFWGQGLVERTLPAQLRIAELEGVVAKCQDLASMAVFLVEENSNVQPDDLSNLPGAVYKYQTAPPQMVVWDGTPGDLKAEISELWQQTLEQEGLSPAMVGGDLVQKGLGSARAVRAADDVTTRRQVIPTRALESYYLQVGQLIEDLNDDCLALDSNYTVKGYTRAGRQNFITSSKWADLQLPEGDARLTMMPMSATPTTVQGRLAALEEYISAGFVSKSMAISLLEFPDIAAWATLETSDVDLVEWQIERLLDGYGELPIPNQDGALAKKMVNQAFLVAYRMQAPPEIQQAFLDYIAYARQLWPDAPPPSNDLGPAALNQEAAAAAQLAPNA